LDKRLAGRIEEMDKRLTGRIDEMDKRLSGQIDKVERRLDRVDRRLEFLSDNASQLNSRIGRLEGALLPRQ